MKSTSREVAVLFCAAVFFIAVREMVGVAQGLAYLFSRSFDHSGGLDRDE
ncbi:hypothetical protein ACFYTQ_28320 [Nocardia sp. NPDC004068]